MSRFLAACALMAAILLAKACAPAQRAASLEGPDEPASTRTEWPFKPVRVRLHPLSRCLRDATGCRVQVLVECQDAFDDATRAVGMLWVQVGKESVAKAVEVDLSSIDANRAAWDRVLRVYRLQVELPPEACPAPSRLPVELRLRLPEGGVLQTQGEIACP